MRLQVRSTLDPRWREAVVMGVALAPGNALFSQAGWNTPRFGDTGVMPSSPATPAPAAQPTPPAPPSDEDLADLAALAATPAPGQDAADEDWDSLAQSGPVQTAPAPAPAPEPEATPEPEPGFLLEPESDLASDDAFELVDPDAPAADSGTDTDTELADAAASADDDASATKIELAKAYLDIGDVDGARGMLEEVVAEGSPAEAERLLREIG